MWLALPWLAACAGAESDGTDWFGPPVDPVEAPACDPHLEPVQIGARVDVAVLRGRGVTPERLHQLTSDLQHFWGPWGVRFGLVQSPRVVTDTPVLAGAPDEIEAALRHAGVDPDAPLAHVDPQVVEGVVTDVVLAPLRAFLRRHARPGRADLLVVALPRIAAPNTAATEVFTSLDGLTVAPHLAHTDGPGAELLAALDMPEAFTPTAFVAVDELDARRPDAVDVTLAHEVGHALGLAHHPDRDNLMFLTPPRCVPSLDAEQVAVVRGAQLGSE